MPEHRRRGVAAGGLERDGEGFRLVLRRRGSKETETLTTDLAFDCTGHRPDLNSPLIQSLVAQGAVCEDAHRLVIALHGGKVKAGEDRRVLTHETQELLARKVERDRRMNRDDVGVNGELRHRRQCE
jgi:uncharacterized NAD(P)/FAD-binding protein YdhS